ncbi:DUF5696 domain-containing protein [Paenibacillus alkaliterrae]|uniref:DUF5696 domain-containing protein n=1 Tax=Paenibacillus alkaliterrae TaxID=320909 RepID=UPI001F1C7890|nr:DUF5696 domain-containing protein [Paenibacillus alkaliterrae]MCF2938012.1 DUF5696 domain-containing protein [Paenibacillus alkaliterrae]
MKRLFVSKRGLMTVVVCIVSIAALASFAIAGPLADKQQDEVKVSAQAAEAKDTSGASAVVKPAAPNLDKGEYKQIAESKYLTLKANSGTGHFTVTDKRTGHVWKSFPDEKGYIEKENQGKWKANLESPLLYSYVEFNVRQDLAKEDNLKDGKGIVSKFEATGQGFKVQYEIPDLGFVIPAEVRLGDDYVETKILQDGLKDERVFTEAELKTKKDNEARLVSVRLFPFLGAQTSEEENGYLFLPDGSGAIVEFKKDRGGTNNYYSERVYGADWAYSANTIFSIRKPVRMPVFGIKSGKQAMIGVIHDGSEYANLVAAPSKTFSQYNWVTAEQNFRFMYYQYTNTKKTAGYVSYTKDITASDRSVRYYLIGRKDADYVQMAARYRQYLTEELGMQPLQANGNKLELQLHLLGADSERGFLRDSYLPLTTTRQAQEIVQELNTIGIEGMSITYLGWQRKGFSQYGGSFPLSSKLGGNDGMQQFVDFTHAKGYEVYLDASSYSFNNTGKDGFRRNRDGLRDIGASVMEYYTRGSDKKNTFVSPRFAEKVILDELSNAQALHVDGYVFGQGIGSLLNTDFNENYAATREETKQIQQRIFETTKNALGHVQVEDGNVYALQYVNHVQGLNDDISNDLFVDRGVPFVQIALHGLVTYSANYANDSDDYETTFLKGIEYGAVPSFIVTYAKSQQLLKTRSLGKFYSTYYKDWLQEMAMQYQQYNEALGDVRNQFITGHRSLADGVFETSYAGGKRIVVNYNAEPYAGNGWIVKPKDFAVVKQGGIEWLKNGL